MSELICPKCQQRSREKIGKYYRSTCWVCRVDREANNLRGRRYRQDLRKQILEHYGEVCSCCGEKEKRFLTFDHKNNDGGQFRKKNGKDNMVTMRWIINNGYPDSIQVLCFNCNCGRQANGGICPHKQNLQ